MTTTSTEHTVSAESAIPDNQEIDALLSLYLDADRNVTDAIEKRRVFAERIEVLIKKHGFLPPRAKKSKRLQGDEFRATLSQSHSVDVDSTAVTRLHAAMKALGVSRWFRRLFRREEIFVLADDAQDLITKLAGKVPGSGLELLFASTLKIESRSATLKVEALADDKAEQKKEKAA